MSIRVIITDDAKDIGLKVCKGLDHDLNIFQRPDTILKLNLQCQHVQNPIRLNRN